MRKLSLSKVAWIVCLFCVATAIASPAGTKFKTLVVFELTNGAGPYASLTQGTDGNYYGTTGGGGSSTYYGTVFKMTPEGALTTLYSFCSQTNCPDGAEPNAPLVQAAAGSFYGTTENGGASGLSCSPIGACGTVFRITTGGKLTTLYSFCSQTNCADGAVPVGLVQATDGNFYGVTQWGGANSCLVAGQNWGCGTVFEITPAGKLTTLHSFGGTDGEDPQGLVQATDGKFYGTTAGGGANSCIIGIGCGTFFKLTPAGKLTTLYSFCPQTSCADGADPQAGPLQAADGSFYGTTNKGGIENSACGGLGCGTVFKISPAGKLSTLHRFNGKEGYWPATGLVQATDENFYGTAGVGGNDVCDYGCGTVFTITPAGKLTTLHVFDDTDGDGPGGLLQATSGIVYGVTVEGGDLSCGSNGLGCGTIYSLSVGLGPFVETQPTSGKVGTKVIILGDKLKGTTSVAFNGTAATFTVVSNTEIKAGVPTGATTGYVTVTTPSGTLQSNVAFRVTK